MRLLKISTCPCSWGPVIQWDPCIWLTISDLIQCRCILGVYVYWGDIYMCVYWEYICVMHMCICITTNLYHTYLSIYQPLCNAYVHMHNYQPLSHISLYLSTFLSNRNPNPISLYTYLYLYTCSYNVLDGWNTLGGGTASKIPLCLEELYEKGMYGVYMYICVYIVYVWMCVLLCYCVCVCI